MTTLHLCIVMATVLFIVAMVCLTILALEFNAPERAGSLVGSTLAVTTHPDDVTYRGVVVADHEDRITLGEAFVVTPTGEQPLAKVVHLYREHFSAVQEIGTDNGPGKVEAA